jgi:hypothetical protein
MRIVRAGQPVGVKMALFSRYQLVTCNGRKRPLDLVFAYSYAAPANSAAKA